MMKLFGKMKSGSILRSKLYAFSDSPQFLKIQESIRAIKFEDGSSMVF
jgi:hypothetical protein